MNQGPAPGEVWLVGAGPGDPGLLTLRAASALRVADIVFHDALPGRAVLAMARADATLQNVGKRKGNVPWPQERINAALIEAARAGQRVVRLKGGDPLLFGRGGEELLALAAAGIPVDVVPGVSSASAAAAVLRMPLTHRGAASAVSFVTGHDFSGKLPANIETEMVAQLRKLEKVAGAQEHHRRYYGCGREPHGGDRRCDGARAALRSELSGGGEGRP